MCSLACTVRRLSCFSFARSYSFTHLAGVSRREWVHDWNGWEWVCVCVCFYVRCMLYIYPPTHSFTSPSLARLYPLSPRILCSGKAICGCCDSNNKTDIETRRDVRVTMIRILLISMILLILFFLLLFISRINTRYNNWFSCVCLRCWAIPHGSSFHLFFFYFAYFNFTHHHIKHFPVVLSVNWLGES